jgi:hypothetical protein
MYKFLQISSQVSSADSFETLTLATHAENFIPHLWYILVYCQYEFCLWFLSWINFNVINLRP